LRLQVKQFLEPSVLAPEVFATLRRTSPPSTEGGTRPGDMILATADRSNGRAITLTRVAPG
jgi:hypothetical protein